MQQKNKMGKKLNAIICSGKYKKMMMITFDTSVRAINSFFSPFPYT